VENIAGTLIGIVCGGLFILGFAGAGIFLIYRSWQSKQKAEASQSWPSTRGQVTMARVQHNVSTDSEGDRHDYYSPLVEYTYEVGGQAYTGRTIRFGFNPSFGNEAKAQAALASYPVGAQVTVYYNPNNPAEAVLERKASATNTGMILGIIFIAVSACLACPLLLALVFRAFSGTSGVAP